MLTSTTGTSIESYLDWIKNELDNKDYGEVSIVFTVTRGQVTDVRKTTTDNEHFSLGKKAIDEIEVRR